MASSLYLDSISMAIHNVLLSLGSVAQHEAYGKLGLRAIVSNVAG